MSRAAGAVILVAAVVGLAVGLLTAPAQGLIGDSLGSLANSAGPWCLAAFLMGRMTASPRVGALLGVVTSAMCEIGYVISNDVRGGSNATSTIVFWLTAAAIAGPELGVAGVWSRRGDPLRLGAGFGVLCGVLIGEGAYGLARLTDTTNTGYWIGEVTLGVLIIVALSSHKRSWRVTASCTAVAALAAVVVYAAAILA